MNDSIKILQLYANFLEDITKKYDIGLVHKVIWDFEKTFCDLVKLTREIENYEIL